MEHMDHIHDLVGALMESLDFFFLDELPHPEVNGAKAFEDFKKLMIHAPLFETERANEAADAATRTGIELRGHIQASGKLAQ
jgi:hypothetical protein